MAMRQRPITPEHDQSIETKCKLDGGIGNTVCQKSVDMVTIVTTSAMVLMGEDILLKTLRTSMSDAKTAATATTVVSGMD